MLGILCGLESEARIARKIDGALVACAAARPQKGRELARDLVVRGATRLMSFGIAGSLESSVLLGDVFIGTRVMAAHSKWDCDDAWGRELSQKIPQARRGGVYGSDTLVATVLQKDALHRATACAIVDMESQCVAEVAAERRLPMAVVRAVCDDSHMNVPPFVIAAIGEDGQVDIMRALSHIARHPLQFGDLIRVGRGTGEALGALREVRGAIPRAA